MLFRAILLPSLIVPALVAGIVYLLWEPLRRRSERLPDAGALAVALAFAAANVAMTGWPRWPPVEASQRLLYFVLGLAVLATIAAGRKAQWATPALAAVVLALLLPLLLETPIRHTWSLWQAAGWIGALWLVGLAIHNGFLSTARYGGLGAATPSWGLVANLPRWLLLAGLAPLLGLAASVRLAQLAAAVLAAVVVVDLLRRRISGDDRVEPSRPEPPVLAALVVGLLVIAHFYADLDLWSAALAALAFTLLTLPGHRRLRWLAVLPMLLALAMSAWPLLFGGPVDPYYDY